MTETLTSVGIDIGTSTTQLVVSKLTLENRANPFSVPRIAIAGREIIYRSGIHFTPLKSDTVIDADGVRAIVESEYQQAGLRRDEVQTGAVIITGETARKENASEVLNSLAGLAGDFVVATAGPELESILAARGAGADEYSKENHTKILHFDIGGGTSNLALYNSGQLCATDCLDIGGRLIKVAYNSHEIAYITPPFEGKFSGVVRGARATAELLAPVVDFMVAGLEGAIPRGVTDLSFSGGVADCMWATPADPFAYGDIGPLLGPAIRKRLEHMGYHLIKGAETIRATVIGAGAHSLEVSGSTIFYHQVTFPLKNLPVLSLSPEEAHGSAEQIAAAIGGKLGWYADESGLTQVALALGGEASPPYRRVREIARGVTEGLRPLTKTGYFPVVVVEADMAKVLGQAMFSGLPILCLDGISVTNGDYIDIGTPVADGAVLPVVVKTLAFQKRS